MKNEKQQHKQTNNNVAQKEAKYFLKKVIKRIPQKIKSTQEDCVITRYPLKIGVVGLLAKKEVKYYEVYNTTDHRNYAEKIQDVRINDFDTGMTIIISLRYRLRCPSGEEMKLTGFLGTGESPEKVLVDYIDKYSHGFYNDSVDDFIVNLDQNIKELSSSLEVDLKQKAGLDFSVKAFLKNQDQVKDIYTTGKIKVVPKDMEHFIELNINYILKVENRNLAALYMNNTTDFEKIKNGIHTIISEYISSNIVAHQLFYRFLNKENELKELVHEINNMLVSYGRKIQFQKMDSENTYLKKMAEVEVEDRRIPVDRVKDNIVIKNKFQFELEDAGKYLEARMPNLKDWSKEEITKLFALKVFDWEYIDFLVNFEDLKSEMEAAMKEKASKIGYKINQIISEPKLEENVFLRMDTHMFEFRQLATADAGITSDFNVTVTFMLNEKQAFRELLKYDDNAKESLRKMFEVELKKVLSYETPERIFLQYYNDKFQGSDQSLKYYLEEKIKHHFEDKLNATVQDIHIVPVDNGILEPLYAVRGQSEHIELELAPKIEGIPIKFRATLVVHGQDNNNWSQLIEGKYTMKLITDLVVRTLQAEFNMLSDDELRFTSLEHRRAIEKIADKLAKDIVSKRYGLVVEIENLDRDKNNEEQLSFMSRQKKLEYAYRERESNLDYLTDRNKQDRDQMLHLSTVFDDEAKEEMNEYSKRVGIEEINLSIPEDDNSNELSGLMKLAQETKNLEHIEELQINNQSNTDKVLPKSIEEDNSKDNE